MRWNLASIYPTIQLAYEELQRVQQDLDAFERLLSQLDLKQALDRLQIGSARLKQVEAYASCVLAEAPTSTEGIGLQASCTVAASRVEIALQRLRGVLNEDFHFKTLLAEVPAIAFFLEEQRHVANKRMDGDREALASSLSIDGFHSYWSLYLLMCGKMRLEFRGEKLSMGQAEALLFQPEPQLRSAVFAKIQSEWASQADFFAHILNHIAGFRLHLQEARGYHSILEEPLERNRMSRDTLEALWSAVVECRPLFLRYFAHKAKKMGLKKLSWQDLHAPIQAEANNQISYEQSLEKIISYFRAWHVPLADFSERAEKKQWIEAENRSGKQAGGFCTYFPLKEESRIFMTFQGTAQCQSTLAHELGHGYHWACLEGVPYFAQLYPMNLGETASTLAEHIVSDGALRSAQTDAEKLRILDDRLQRASVFCMNLYARFLFEMAFYEERRKGLVSAERLSALMLEAQKEASGDAFEAYYPLFWASKMHFYLTEEPFYNFPYVVGFFLSLKLLNFPEKVDLFLKESGSYSLEELIEKHFGEKPSSKAFWEGIAERFHQDLDAFLSL